MQILHDFMKKQIQTITFPSGEKYVGEFKNGKGEIGRWTFVDSGPVMDLSTTGQRIISEEEID